MPLEPKTLQAMQEARKGWVCSKCPQAGVRLSQGVVYCHDCWEGLHEPPPVGVHVATDPTPKHFRSR